MVAVWALCGVIAAWIFVTYSRTDPAELYHVQREGIAGGLGRVLVFLNWPGALIALAILPLVVERVRAPVAAVTALVLCAAIVVPGVVDQDDLDAKWINVLPALGVAIVLVLTAVAIRRGGVGGTGSARGDGVRIATLVVLGLLSLPWVFAELGVYVGDVPGLRSVFESKQMFDGERAVHLGEHHGFVGFQLVAVALLLSRELPRMRSPRLAAALAVWLAGLIAYGIGNVVNDAWREQLYKRGWVDEPLPSVVRPELNWLWLAVLGATALLYLVFGRRGRLG